MFESAHASVFGYADATAGNRTCSKAEGDRVSPQDRHILWNVGGVFVRASGGAHRALDHPSPRNRKRHGCIDERLPHLQHP
jgi:hypothetical protein